MITAKQIKTIIERRGEVEIFDKKVNSALLDGWELKNRFLDSGFESSSRTFFPALVAFLEKDEQS